MQVNRQIISEGEFDVDSLEEGPWKFLDREENRVVSEGNFSQGVRTGVWKYYGSTIDSIYWTSYSNRNGTIRTNVPIQLKNVEDSDSSVRFINEDSIRLFNFTVGKGYIADTTTARTYKKLLYEDLTSRKVAIVDSSSDFISTNAGRNYLYTQILGKETNNTGFVMFGLFGRDEKGQSVEIFLRCKEEYKAFGQRVFFSVFPNLFIDSKRFMVGKETVTSVVN